MIKNQTLVEDAKPGVRQPAITFGKFQILEEGQTFLSNDNIKKIPKRMIGIVHDDDVGSTDSNIGFHGAVSVIWADCQAARRARAKAALQTYKRFFMRDFDRSEDDDFKINVMRQMNERQEAIPLYSPIDKKLFGWKIQNKHE